MRATQWPRQWRTWRWVVLGLVLAGCRNDCQQLCEEIQVYAEEECGLSFTPEEVRECVKNEQRKDQREAAQAANEGVAEDEQYTVGDRLEACERNLVNLRSEMTCADLEPYFQASSGGFDSAR